MLLITDIRTLFGAYDIPVDRLNGTAMDHISAIDDAWLLVERSSGTIVDFGTADTVPQCGYETVSAAGGMVLPAFCDSHSHIVYAGSRHGEFCDKIAGLSYEEIAKRGGGILNSADLLHDTNENDLLEQSRQRVMEVAAKGTGALEIKSGYGLNVADELKMLRVIARLRQECPVMIRATFLGAHAVGREYQGRQQEYVDHLIADMLPAVAAEGLADFVDVFCDQGFFTIEQTAAILEAAARYGMRPKIHANELACSGGVQVGVAHQAVSVDHLERIGAEEIALLATAPVVASSAPPTSGATTGGTIATMLPGASFFLGMPYAPAREAIAAGATVALASDYNPGSSPSGDMRMIWALGCIKMRLTPQQALNAVTVNGAAAMDLSHLCGSLSRGKQANFIITTPQAALASIPYQYTTPWIRSVYHRSHPVKIAD